MTKQEIRKTIKELKTKLTLSDINEHSDRIIHYLMNTEAYISCDILFCYISFNQEVLTRGIIRDALHKKKRVAVPKIVGDTMKFFYINSYSDLEQGVLGILEPITKEEATPSSSNKNLVIVPGLAFDPLRNRIGYGKGYYDGFFIRNESIPLKKIALAYDFQVFEQLPVEEHDQLVDMIITEKRLIH